MYHGLILGLSLRIRPLMMNLCCTAVGRNALQMSARSTTMWFTSAASWLNYLSPDQCGYWITTVIMLEIIFSFRCSIFVFIKLAALGTLAYTFMMVTLLWFDPLITCRYHLCLIFSFLTKVYFSYQCSKLSLSVSISNNNFFHSFTFSLNVSLLMKQFCKQHMIMSFFPYIYSAFIF